MEEMNRHKKLKWLERVFSNDLRARRKAMEEKLDQPVFETGQELRRAIDELVAMRKQKEDADK